jgi:hypothetical protein
MVIDRSVLTLRGVACLLVLGACSAGNGSTPLGTSTASVSASTPAAPTATPPSAAPASAPLTYSARTDLDITTSFLGKNKQDANGGYVPTQTAPNIGDRVGANTCIEDPDFHSTICRVTDYSLGLSFTAGAASGNTWAADASAFFIYTYGGTPLLVAFDPTTMKSTISSIGKITAGGGSTSFATGTLTFSSVDPNVLYEYDFGRDDAAGKPIIVLNKLTIDKGSTNDPSKWSLSRSQLFDFVEDSGTCLPLDFHPNWTGVAGVSSDDTAFQLSFSDHGQDGAQDATHPYGATLLAAYDVGKGCRVVHTHGNENGLGPMTITGDWGDLGTVLDGSGAALGVSGGDPLKDTLYLHDSGPTPNDTYSGLSGNAVNPESNPGSCTYSGKAHTCESYFWETGTRNIRPVEESGHSTKGYLFAYKGAGNYFALQYHDPNAPSPPELLPVSVPSDQHSTYNNTDDQDDQPVFLVSTNVCDQASGLQGDRNCAPQYTAPLYDEIFAVENQAAHPTTARHCEYPNKEGTLEKAACVYRFAHTFNTGTNWGFYTQNSEGIVDPTGRFVVFSSDWNLSLGCTNGQDSGCLDSKQASDDHQACVHDYPTKACQRSDVFVVNTESAHP